jgi:DNA-directed RNA polymerase specialized sigma24 family protein
LACAGAACDEHAAEDAYQATFLVLARRAASVRKAEAAGGFLYGVACRTAMCANKATARQTAVAPAACPRPGPEGPEAEASLRELEALLDEEAARLPANCRSAFVLAGPLWAKHHLEGRETWRCPDWGGRLRFSPPSGSMQSSRTQG